MFEYFPTNYPWSLAVSLSLGMGGEISEVEDACRPLRADGVLGSNEAWYQSWVKLAEKLMTLADADETRGWGLSASNKYMRASNYYLAAERMLSWGDYRRTMTYRRALDVFAQGVALSDHQTERVEVDCGGELLTGWLRVPPGPGPHPCIIFFDGFDSIKEMHYMLYSEIAVKRGIALLVIDQHGTGEAIHFRKIARRHDTEVAAGAFVDFLENHPAIDAQRIGVGGVSMGGYDAPRAAAFEKRLKCAFALGSMYCIDEKVEKLLIGAAKKSGIAESLPEILQHAMNVTQTTDVMDMIEKMRLLNLDAAIDKITCPILSVHGGNDRQISQIHAEWTIERAVNSPRADLKIFSISEGSCEHCGIDVPSITAEYCFDWVKDVL